MGYQTGNTIYFGATYLDPTGNAIPFTGNINGVADIAPVAYLYKNGVLQNGGGSTSNTASSGTQISGSNGGWTFSPAIPGGWTNGTDVCQLVVIYTFNGNVNYDFSFGTPFKLDAASVSANIVAVNGTTFSGASIPAYLLGILTTALTETTTGWLAAGFKKLFNVATPVLTSASVNQTLDVGVQVPTPLTYDGNGLPKVDVVDILGTQSPATPGYLGPDWGHVNAPTTTVGLSGTTVGSVTGGATSAALGTLQTAVNALPGGSANAVNVARISYSGTNNTFEIVLTQNGTELTTATNPLLTVVAGGTAIISAQALTAVSGELGAYTYTATGGGIPTAGQTILCIVTSNSGANVFIPLPLAV